MLQLIAIIVCIIAMCVCAITGNIPLTIVNGFLVIMNVILLVAK